jgi:hypothetical protein
MTLIKKLLAAFVVIVRLVVISPLISLNLNEQNAASREPF